MDKRFVQAHKEARWALWLTLLYLAAWLAAAYLPGVGIGFTGQVIGQRYARPAEAAIILSGETVFAALAGAVFLSERLNWYGYLGGALILAGIVIVQILPEPKKPAVAEPFQL